MKVKNFFRIGIICILFFVGLLTYFWYLYFRGYEKEFLAKNVRLEIINNGKTTYFNAIPNDDDSVIPVYYFRVRNNVDVPLSYEIYIEDVKPSSVNDGCTDATFFTREELNYELRLNNKVIKTGSLASLEGNVLDRQDLEGTTINNYAFRVWLDDKNERSLGKHYHYVVNIREK